MVRIYSSSVSEASDSSVSGPSYSGSSTVCVIGAPFTTRPAICGRGPSLGGYVPGPAP